MSFRQDLLKSSSKRRQRELFKKILLGILFLGILVSIVVFLFYIPQFRISNIAIAGLDDENERILRAEVFSLLSGRKWLVIPKDHMVFLSSEKIKSFLADKYRVKDYTFDKDFPSTINISITERKTWAIWCNGSQTKCLLLDKDGLAFDEAENISGSAVLKIIDAREDDFLGKNVLDQESFTRLRTLAENIPRYSGEEIKNINIKSSGETYLLFFKNGAYLIVDSETNAENAIENLLIALKSEEISKNKDNLEYLDLRFEDKVFYKFK